MTWYEKFKSETTYDSNYYCKVVDYLREWFIKYIEFDSFKRTSWIKISDVATKDVNKFIWHLKLYEITRVNLFTAAEADKQYRVILDQWDNPTFFKIFIPKETELLFIEKANNNLPPHKRINNEQPNKSNDKGRTSEQLFIDSR